MEIELDDNLKDLRRSYEECKNKISQISQIQYIRKKSLNCLKNILRMSIEETGFLGNEIKWEPNHVEELLQILDYYVTVEDCFSNLTKENETLKEQVAALQKTQIENQAFWKGEREKLERENEEKINLIKDEYDKQIASSLAGFDKLKKSITATHQQLISHFVKNKEQQLLRLQRELESAHIEIRNLRRRYAAAEQRAERLQQLHIHLHVERFRASVFPRRHHPQVHHPPSSDHQS